MAVGEYEDTSGIHSLIATLAAGTWMAVTAPVAGLSPAPAADPATGGYWLATSAGNVYGFHAPFYGSLAGKKLSSPVVGIAADGAGYLLASAAGNVHAFYTSWYGSMAGKTLPAPIIGISAAG